jgi:putative ABC transport system permease protein
MAHWPEEVEGGGSVYYGFVLPIMVFAPPAETPLLKPTLLQGRWLLPTDESAMVVNTKVMSERPGLEVGDELGLKIGRHDTSWTVVGVVRDIGLMPIVYANYPYYARVLGEVGRASTVAVSVAPRTEANETAVARALEEHLGRVGMRVSLVSKAAEERAEGEAIFNVILVLLLAMAVLLAAVGGLGLMGAMSLSVIERTREVGVMRAIGATDAALMLVFIGEGVLIGVLSWVGGLLIAIPVSKFLSDAVGRAFIDAPLAYSFPVRGALVWLVLVIVISVAASFLPAWRAARVTVREALAYE